MEGYKRLKDPIYGYIVIPDGYMNNIIDTSVFQRLRRIVQTSYAPLYSSALHNRFVHSIGVYHLGEMAATRMEDELRTMRGLELGTDLSKIKEVFVLACLLHDVGHAPFSHTGEIFYLGDNMDYTALHSDLEACVQTISFKHDIPLERNHCAAPHEIMSVIVGIKEFSVYLSDEFSKEFFARCITGYRYTEDTMLNQVLNCYISLLNSKVIDVDKLDYLIRDAYVTGFDTVNIDYQRLLESLTIIRNEEDAYELAYTKNAISIVENVIYAHDAERKWIQNHPVVLYESFLLQHIFGELSNWIKNGVKLFSKEALGKEGVVIVDAIKDDDGKIIVGEERIRMLCDDDIIYLMKNKIDCELVDEYFERRYRRHPIWKSEAEYNALFLDMSQGGSILDNYEKAMQATANYLSKSSNAWFIDDNLIEIIKHELDLLQGEDLEPRTKKIQERQKKDILKVITCLQQYASDIGMDNDFILLMVSQFNSGFGKVDFAETKIVFRNQTNEKVAKVGEIVSSVEARKQKREKFFYLFYKRKEGVVIDKQELCKRLYAEFLM